MISEAFRLFYKLLVSKVFCKLLRGSRNRSVLAWNVVSVMPLHYCHYQQHPLNWLTLIHLLIGWLERYEIYWSNQKHCMIDDMIKTIYLVVLLYLVIQMTI